MIKMIGSKREGKEIQEDVSRFLLYERMASPEVINLIDMHYEN